jgi:hypothetical protein
MRSVALVTLLLAGCNLFFDDDKDPPCYDVANGKGAPIADLQYRNPETGQCESFGNPYPCDDRCGPCPATGEDQAIPDWGSCYSQCEGLAENDCIAATGCFAAYTDFPTQDRAPMFRGCWQTAPSGPVSGACTGLDAQQCSRHDNCSAHYDTKFLACTAETPQIACSALTTEAACQARPDCERIYQGTDCTCTPTDCDCKVLTYERCISR